MARKIILKNDLSPGDVTVMTATIKALHQTHPKEFITGYRGTAPQLMEFNPYIHPLAREEAEVIKMEYPAIRHSNQRPRHFIEAYANFLGEKLGVDIPIKEFRPDIYVSNEEQRWDSQVKEITNIDHPFWIIVVGGKNDFTVKWWDHLRYQQVVNHFRGKICFVRVGANNHYHPPIKGVIDLHGKTDIRQLVRLTYHSQGVLCPVTFMMHLAAGTPTAPHLPKNRPCVAINGGREPTHWEAYPWHQFVHNLGSLPCNQEACWKSRTFPLFDGDEKDEKGALCENPIKREGLLTIPKCMDMISANHVIERIYSYFEGGLHPFLTQKQFEKIEPHLSS